MAAFVERSHQDRYDLCDVILNPPSLNVPCWSIQVACASRHKLFLTSPPSLIVLASSSNFYLLDTVQYKEIIGLWGKKQDKSYQPSGVHNPNRLDTASWLWPKERRQMVEVDLVVQRQGRVAVAPHIAHPRQLLDHERIHPQLRAAAR